jgi:BirA family biotin operon repressor/biotin-[acetyl-CoA-carboxylase] ligase
MNGTKGKILNLLREESAIVSGEAISTTLGLSRTAIWKHIQKLQHCGYDIRASGKGYQLMVEPDVPYAWEFPGREKAIHFYPEISSTMDIARKLARGGCPALTVVTAERQTLGRGRLQRNWQSETGGLYFTVVLRPNLAPMLSLRVNFCVSLVMAKTLQQLYGIPAVVKWPNDILVSDRKIAGMLSEMEAETDRVAYVNVGIGLNVNNDPSSAVPGAVSLKEIVGQPVSRKTILAAYLDALEARLDTIDSINVIDEWKTQTVTIGRKVKIQTQTETSEGTAVDVDENGSLILRLADGSLKTIIYGDCFHL